MLLLINLQQQHIEVKKFLAKINGIKKQYVILWASAQRSEDINRN
jgi:hypothetical protein